MPAVAAIQGRLVLFIFIRFKGYLDGFYRSIRVRKNESLIEEANIRAIGVEIECFDTDGTGKGEGKPLCKN